MTTEALAAALQDAYDKFDDHKKRHPGHQGTCQDDWPNADTLAHGAAAALSAAGLSIVSTEELEGLRRHLTDACDAWVAEFGPPDYPRAAPTWFRDARAALEGAKP
jgi:hypothetical protein